MSENYKDTISVIIPCFDEIDGIRQLVLKLKGLETGLRSFRELIFVDDGSSDSTYDALMENYKERLGKDVKIIKHPRNMGVGAAVRTGISASDGAYLATIDSDCTYEPDYLIGMFEIIREEKADIITASPYHPMGSTSGVPAYRLFLSRNLSRLYNAVSKSKFHTYTSMFRIYRKEAIKGIDFKSDGFLAMAEILIKARKNGLKIIEYPAVLKGRSFGVSNAKTLKLIKEHLLFIAKILFGKE